jgi:hypothetical protein
MSQSDAGKGDTYRPVRQDTYDKNFQRMTGVCFTCPHYLGDDCQSKVGCTK